MVAMVFTHYTLIRAAATVSHALLQLLSSQLLHAVVFCRAVLRSLRFDCAALEKLSQTISDVSAVPDIPTLLYMQSSSQIHPV